MLFPLVPSSSHTTLKKYHSYELQHPSLISTLEYIYVTVSAIIFLNGTLYTPSCFFISQMDDRSSNFSFLGFSALLIHYIRYQVSVINKQDMIAYKTVLYPT